VSLSTVVVKHEAATFDFREPKELAPKKLLIDELEEEEATRPAPKKPVAQQPQPQDR
jgi:hypothetical protein